jgi:hypothetical protein
MHDTDSEAFCLDEAGHDTLQRALAAIVGQPEALDEAELAGAADEATLF